MSAYYAASQFDHAFEPKKLRNWQYGLNPWPGKFTICGPVKCGSTKFIACDNGHLFPCVPRNNCTSPWGDYSTWIWENSPPCECIRMERHPHLYKPQRLIYITKEVNKPGKFSIEAAKEFNCPETKEGMMEDLECGRDPSCPGQQCPGPFLKLQGKLMSGDKASIRKKLAQEVRDRRREKVKLSKLGGGLPRIPNCPPPLTFRFAVGCGQDEKAKRGCKTGCKL